MMRLILPTVLALTVAFGTLGVSVARAMEVKVPLVERLVDRFDLNEDEVIDVVEEFRADALEILEDRFDQLVEAGKITEAQKELMLEESTGVELSGLGLFEADASHDLNLHLEL